MTSPDPVAQPGEYQRLILGYLGDDDPAEVQAGTPTALHALVAEAGADLRTRPAAAEWSVVELIGHITDAELVSSTRYRWILAHDTPPIMPYDQDLWAQRLHYDQADAAELLALFEPLRAANLALWRRTPAAERTRFGIHAERGPESYELTFRLIGGHDRFHVAQARRTLAAVRDAKERLFWGLAQPRLREPMVTRSTMMGFPCLRLDGRFFASIDRDTRDLVVKLPAERVADLIESGQGTVFAPNNRVFREWVAVPLPNLDVWKALMEEAIAFAAGAGL